MSENGRILAPTADEVERRFRSPAVVVTRPAIIGAVRMLRFARRFGWETNGIGHLNGDGESMLFAANHQSHVDTAAILGTLPRLVRNRTAVAAALDVFGHPDNGSTRSLKRECLQLVVAAGFHAFAFDRYGAPLRSIRTAGQLLRNGWSILLYPEGTRSRTGQMGPFKAGVGVLARFTQRPVVPVHVSGGRRILPCGATVPRPGRVAVRYGAALYYEAGETARTFTIRLQEAVYELGSIEIA